MYHFHFDHQHQHWNVFDGRGFYVCSFPTAEQAREFCEYSNVPQALGVGDE